MEMPIDLARNVMVDIETAGKRPGCIILAIAACTFDKQKIFKNTIDIKVSRAAGFTEDRDTMAWWNKQNPQLRELMFSGTTPTLIALNDFSDWLKRIHEKDIFVWSKGSNFDFPIIEAAYDKYDLAAPWHYRNVRDLRTLTSLVPHVQFVRPAIAHDPLEDCYAQVDHAVKVLQVL